MDVKLFNALFPLKIQSLLEELRKQHSFSLSDALRLLYTSRTYALLEKEETKLWHYSPRMLVEMLFHEKETGEVYFPDLV
ncbi:hypothetical protein [uncultured Parabacteroides sp.]|uniref:hypothetical protein n=1 Tax=uncultured Parabacteroides sp. TaxID=512312 RepID=UPI0025ED906C|nr:hypothetical protein [uncultured Parabacteroides sp.]